MGVATRWLEARRIRNRTPDFSSSNSSIDSLEVTRSMISFSSFRFIRINPRSIADERAASSLRKSRQTPRYLNSVLEDLGTEGPAPEQLPRRLFELISGTADLVSRLE